MLARLGGLGVDGKEGMGRWKLVPGILRPVRGAEVGEGSECAASAWESWASSGTEPRSKRTPRSLRHGTAVSVEAERWSVEFLSAGKIIVGLGSTVTDSLGNACIGLWTEVRVS